MFLPVYKDQKLCKEIACGNLHQTEETSATKQLCWCQNQKYGLAEELIAPWTAPTGYTSPLDFYFFLIPVMIVHIGCLTSQYCLLQHCFAHNLHVNYSLIPMSLPSLVRIDGVSVAYCISVDVKWTIFVLFASQSAWSGCDDIIFNLDLSTSLHRSTLQ